MERVSQEDLNKLDKVGAHFKFPDMYQILKLVIAENRQEKRSNDLLAYQAYFS
jgi:hypothetical protein